MVTYFQVPAPKGFWKCPLLMLMLLSELELFLIVALHFFFPICDRFGHMKRAMSTVLFKGFLVWCMLFSHVIQRFLVLLNQEYHLRWVCSFLNSRFGFGKECSGIVYIIMIPIFWWYCLMSDQNQRNSELQMFNLCYSLSSYLYFLVTKKSLRLQVYYTFSRQFDIDLELFSLFVFCICIFSPC